MSEGLAQKGANITLVIAISILSFTISWVIQAERYMATVNVHTVEISMLKESLNKIEVKIDRLIESSPAIRR